MAHFLWTQKQDFGPKPRTGHAMAFDSTRKKTVLFGGGESAANSVFKDTWEWDGELWSQMSDMGPGARRDLAMAYDSTNKHTIIFGGIANTNFFGDTWSWDGDAWTQLSNSGPAPRRGHAMVFNKARNTILLFGGESAPNTVLGDTWEFDGTEWTQLDETGPAARRFHAMAFDSIRNRVVLFGGVTSDSSGGASNDASLGDTWELNGTTWVQTADFGPDKSLSSSMTFANSHVILFGGMSSLNLNPPPVIFDNSWEWDGKHWTQRQDIGPTPRWGHVMCFDSERKSIVLFGGLSSPDALQQNFLGDTWEHLDTTVATPDPGTTPGPRPGPITDLTIASITLSPDSVTVSQVPNVTALVTLSGAVTNANVTVPLFFISQSLAETQPLPPGTQPTLISQVIIPVGAATGSTQLGTANITETSFILTPQLDDPGNIITALLTIVPG